MHGMNDESSPGAGQAKRFSWVRVVVLLLVVGGPLLWMTRPTVIRSERNSDLTEAVSNARQIGLALFEFDLEYGSYPSVGTIGAVEAKTGTSLRLGKATSNDFFRQLIAAELVTDEGLFHVKGKGVRKPGWWSSDQDVLGKGECGFAYIRGLSSKGNPSRPIVMAPVVPGTRRFDPEPFDGHAVVLRIDNSVTRHRIDPDGRLMRDGMDWLDPSHPVWGAEKPVTAWPDL